MDYGDLLSVTPRKDAEEGDRERERDLLPEEEQRRERERAQRREECSMLS